MSEQKSGLENVSKRYMEMPELQTYLGVSRSTVYTLIRQRKMPFIALSKRAYRFDRVEIDTWMKSKKIETMEEYENRRG